MSNFDAEEFAANPCGSFFNLTFWPEGTVSGLRVKPLSDPPGLMKFMEDPLSWQLSGIEEQVDAWDVVGEWDNCKICLQLLPRRGGSPVLLRGEWGARVGLVSSVELEFIGGMWKRGLELVRKELLREEEGQMQEVRQSLKRLHSYFASNKLEGFDDLTVAAADGREVRSSRLVFTSQSEYFNALLRQEPHTKRVQLSYEGEVLRTIFDFLLAGDLDVDPDNVQEVMETADFLGITGLVTACEREVVVAIDLENCLEVWSLGERLSRPMLVDKAELFLFRNLQNVLNSKSRSLAMPPALLNKLLNDSRLCVFGGNGARLWGMERLETLKSLLSKWEGRRRTENPFDLMETEVFLPPLDPSQGQEYILEVSRPIGRPVWFCGNINTHINQGKSFMFQGGGEMAAVTLGWRSTNLDMPVLTGIAIHWDTGRTDSVGQVGTGGSSDLLQVEEDEEVELERLDLDAGEHFTVVIGVDQHCIQQLNFVTSKGRVRVAERVVQDLIKAYLDTSGAWAPTYGKWPVLASIYAIDIYRHLHGELPI